MPSIYSYRKYITPEISKWLVIPTDPDTLESLGTELATIDGATYVSIPDNTVLPEQPAEIAATVKLITLTTELKSAIKQASPHVQLIEQRIIEKIRAVYPLDREQYFARISAGVTLSNALQMPIYAFKSGELDEILEFGRFVEESVEWGRDQKAKLGL